MLDLERQSVESGAVDVGEAGHVAHTVMGGVQRHAHPPIGRRRMAQLILRIERAIGAAALARAAIVFIGEAGLAGIADVSRRRKPEDLVAGDFRHRGRGLACERRKHDDTCQPGGCYRWHCRPDFTLANRSNSPT